MLAWIRLSILLLVGGSSAGVAIWLADYRDVIAHWGPTTTLLLGTFFATWTWALVGYLHRRDRYRSTLEAVTGLRDELAGTVYGLVPGNAYRVSQAFSDYYGHVFECGEVLHFRQRHFLPHDGGHTIVFEERSLYLQETQNEVILGSFSDYLTPVAAVRPN